jgi:hypothetical protein
MTPRTRYYYDTEFIDDGVTIDLVSIGIVSEDGREFYAVSSEFNVAKLHANPWLVENVRPYLPQQPHPPGMHCRCIYGWHLDIADPAVRPRAQIARAVRDFLLGGNGKPELWAWYGAYDHVALAQLWGPMISLPAGIPMWTNDLRQEAERLGNPQMPEQDVKEHHALADARHNRVMHHALGELEGRHG